MDNINDNVIPNTVDKVAVIDFYSDYCPACVPVQSIVSKMEHSYNDSVKFFKCNVSSNMQLSRKYMVMGLPTVLVIKNNKVMSQITGSFSENKLDKIIKEVLRS